MKVVAAIPDIIDDLVGLRIVCNNQSDVDRVVEILEAIGEDSNPEVLAVCPVSERKDWRTTPKDSGYRAYHLNLAVSVSQGTQRRPVICELQVRTLLQDSWGELTHEDTYKPGDRVPELFERLSRRMADLMATLDDLAQDLRSALDDRDEMRFEETATPLAANGSSTVVIDGAKRYLAERIRRLDKPIDFASLAWKLQREFGQEIVEGWDGHGTFKELLKAAAPDVRISPHPPSYVLPAGFDGARYEPRDLVDVPRAVALLHDADRSFPLIGTETWPRLYALLARATHSVAWTEPPNIRTVNDLSRVGRDAADPKADGDVNRRHLAYVARALLFGQKQTRGMDEASVAEVFASWTMKRARGLGLLEQDLGALDAWLHGRGHQAI